MNGKDLLARAGAWKEPRFFDRALFALACLPALVATAAMASDILRRTRFFGSNPIKEGEHFLGEWALRFLIFTLAVTPLRGLFGWAWLGKHRRTLGLFAFAYAVLHWLVYVFLDVQLDWNDLVKDLSERSFIIVGMAALLLMLPLALTSSAWAIRRLGGRNWGRLHLLVYPAAILGTLHFGMAMKKDIEDPLIFAACFAVLFGYRIARWLRARRTAPA